MGYAAGGATAAAAAAQHASSYRVKFRRREFLELVDIARPSVIYHRRRMHFFAFDGFVMYTFECDDRDFSQKVLEALEFSNYQWSE
jgi:predicted ATP-grasp superfamily ATP-dependent carboligase